MRLGTVLGRVAWMCVLLVSMLACSAAFMIVDYPVSERSTNDESSGSSNEGSHASDSAGPGADAGLDSDQLDRSRYWSAYMRLEARDIMRLWDDSPSDYLLISAKVMNVMRAMLKISVCSGQLGLMLRIKP